MAFLIRVFNPTPIEEIRPSDILAAITESNYATLCAQYGLDPALIPAARERLSVLASPLSGVPYFAVTYREAGAQPVMVHFQDWSWDGACLDGLAPVPEPARQALSQAVQVVTVALSEDQLRDMGLLLGYELARWAAVQGDGIMRALDGRWYRLNAYKAFLPLDAEVPAE